MDPSGAGAQVAPQHRAQQIHFQKFCPENVQHNAKQLYYVRSVFTAVAGSTAGILGLVNLRGFYFYLASILVINSVIFLVNVQAQPSRYLMSFNVMQADPTADARQIASKAATGQGGLHTSIWSYISFLFEGAQEMAFGFVLWWTLWTALIHVYD